MTKGETIAKFHLYIDDTSELSTSEESDLYDKILNFIYRDRPWEILKKAHTATQSTSLPYVSLPDDFAFLVQNGNHTELNAEAEGPVVFVGSAYTPYKVVSWSDRRQYRNRDGFAYIDIANRRLYFTLQPVTAQAIEFDYHFIPAALATSESPVFPTTTPIADAIYHGMCIDSFIIQQSDKAKSYAVENQVKYNQCMSDLAYWNANLVQMN